MTDKKKSELTPELSDEVKKVIMASMADSAMVQSISYVGTPKTLESQYEKAWVAGAKKMPRLVIDSPVLAPDALRHIRPDDSAFGWFSAEVEMGKGQSLNWKAYEKVGVANVKAMQKIDLRFTIGGENAKEEQAEEEEGQA